MTSEFALTRRYHFSAGHRLENPALDAEDNEFVIGLVGKELYPLSHLVQGDSGAPVGDQVSGRREQLLQVAAGVGAHGHHPIVQTGGNFSISLDIRRAGRAG